MNQKILKQPLEMKGEKRERGKEKGMVHSKLKHQLLSLLSFTPSPPLLWSSRLGLLLLQDFQYKFYHCKVFLKHPLVIVSDYDPRV